MLRPGAETARRVERRTGDLVTAALAGIEATLPWYSAMPPAERSGVGLVVQAGITAFLGWMRSEADDPPVPAEVFGSAPRELARVVSLQQTVQLIRAAIRVVEERIDELAAPGEEAALREAVLRFSREVAFAAAGVYAAAAESRGAWDARLESLVIDALLRDEVDEGTRSRAGALGWGQRGGFVVVVGHPPDSPPDVVAAEVQRAARGHGVDAISALQGDRLVVAVGGANEAVATGRAFVGQFAAGPVVVGPLAAELADAGRAAQEAVAGLLAAPAWPAAPRPVPSSALLPERALAGDRAAADQLVARGYAALADAGGDLVATLAAYLDGGGSIEGAARALFVHPNTVRYRLRRVATVSGFAATEPRGAYALRLAISLGRLRTAVLEETSKAQA